MAKEGPAPGWVPHPESKKGAMELRENLEHLRLAETV